MKKPPKGEAWGLSHHLLKLLVFMIGLRLREQVDESHVYNMLYFVLKHYRSEGNKDVGMHYAQALFNRLHKKSWWKSQGTLKTHLESVNKDVLESLRLKYPKVDRPSPKGGKDSFRKASPGGKKWTPSPQYTRYSRGKGAWQTGRPTYKGGGKPWVNVRDRSRSRNRAGGGSKNEKDGGKGLKGKGTKGD